MRPLLIAHLSILLFWLASVIAKLLPFSSWDVVLGRVLISSWILLIVCFIQWVSVKISLKQFLIYLLMGWFLFWHRVSIFHAVKISSIATGVLSMWIYPLFILVGQYFLIWSHIWKKERWACCWSLFGLCIFVWWFWEIFTNSWILYGTLSALLFACFILCNNRFKWSDLLIKQVFRQHTMVLLLSILVIILHPNMIRQGIWSYISNYKQLLLRIVLWGWCTLLAHGLYINSLKYISTSSLSIMTNMQPIYAIIWGYLLLWEQLAVVEMIWWGIIVLSLSLLSLPTRKKFSKR